ncbi:MAG: threonine/serine exporter family protein [Chthoniobacterales bacterium]
MLETTIPLANDPSLTLVARLCISAGKLLLQSGASGRIVNEAVSDISSALGCDSAEVLVQHAAVLVTIHRGAKSCMQMSKAAEHGVNLRRTQAVRQIIRDLIAKKLDCAAAQNRMDRVLETTAAYPVWMVCVATGVACGSFGRLLGADWPSFLPTLIGSACGQWLRHTLFHKRHNIFVVAVSVSFLSAFIAGLGARLSGSANVPLASVAAVLLLVPGIAILNAQVDILEGKPNLAAARALRVLYLLLFMALGLALAQALVLPHP